jgi:hypothetical protein
MLTQGNLLLFFASLNGNGAAGTGCPDGRGPLFNTVANEMNADERPLFLRSLNLACRASDQCSDRQSTILKDEVQDPQGEVR